MNAIRLLAVVAVLAALLVPAVAGAVDVPSAPAAATSAVQVPPSASALLGAIFADSGGLPCTHICFISKDCGCDPPVILSCSGCSSCTQGLFWIQCDGVRQTCLCPY
jgi:hypothetical protein